MKNCCFILQSRNAVSFHLNVRESVVSGLVVKVVFSGLANLAIINKSHNKSNYI